MPTALITHPACLHHDNGPYHPECPGSAARGARRAGGRGIRRPAARGGAARHRRAAHARASGELCRGDPGDPSGRGRNGAARRRHGDERRQCRGGVARGGCGGGGGGCGDGGLGACGVRRGAPAGAPCRTVAADGLLPVQQCRGGGDACAGRGGTCRASRWWISTCTTATARRRCSRRMPTLFYASSHQHPVLSGDWRGVGARVSRTTSSTRR